MRVVERLAAAFIRDVQRNAEGAVLRARRAAERVVLFPSIPPHIKPYTKHLEDQ